MKTRLKQFLATLVVALGIAAVPVVPAAAINVDPLQGVCESGASSQVCDKKDDNITDVIITVINVLLFLVGVISVIMIIIGGIRFATSAGDSGSVTAGKNTIMYAVIGLVVAFFAYAIVNWVIKRFI